MMAYGVIHRDLPYVGYFSHMGSSIPQNIMFTLYNNTLAVSTATIKDPIYFYKSYIQVTTRDCISKR